MSLQFNPTLEPLEVFVHQLFLDPGNPRLFGHLDPNMEKENPTSALTQTALRNLLTSKGDKFKMSTLEHSILTNGWQPVDLMFVKKIANEDGKYLVLEGNRRLATIMSVLENENTPDELRTALKKLNVMEVVQGGLSDAEFKRQIDYLLGVRHHGSLLEWRPYAQAKRIFETYMSRCSNSEFAWDEDVAQQVAAQLTMLKKTVQERLETFIVMRQMNAYLEEETGNPECMKAHYYSITREFIVKSSKGRMKELFQRDQSSFLLLRRDSLSRLERLCHFSVPGRAGAPMSSPPEWRSYQKIIEDTDEIKRDQNMAKVEQEGAEGFKEKPSNVWARRSSEINRPTWPVWLRNTIRVLDIPFSQVQWTADTELLVKQLMSVLDELEQHTHTAGGAQ